MTKEQKEEELARLFSLWATISKMVVDGARDTRSVASVLQRVVDTPVSTSPILRSLYESETLVVPATNGETFSSAKFWVDYPLLLDRSDRPMGLVRAWELVNDNTDNLFSKDERVWTEPQIVAFVRENKSKLRGPYGGNLFHCGKVVCSFSYDDIWCPHIVFTGSKSKFDAGRKNRVFSLQ